MIDLGPGEIDQRVLCFQLQTTSNQPTKTFIFATDGPSFFMCFKFILKYYPVCQKYIEVKYGQITMYLKQNKNYELHASVKYVDIRNQTS